MSDNAVAKKSVYELYNDILNNNPDIEDQLEVTLLQATEQNIKVTISLHTSSMATDDTEIKVLSYTGRYFDCSVYPVSGTQKLPPKQKSAPQNSDESKPKRVYEAKTILDGNHKFIVGDLLDTYHSENIDKARNRINNMKHIKDRIGDDEPRLLHELMSRLLKYVIKTVQAWISTKERYQAMYNQVLTRLTMEDPALQAKDIDWNKLTCENIESNCSKHKDASSMRLFPTWFVDWIKNPNRATKIECPIYLYCNEGVYESIACGIIFYEMLRLFKVDNLLKRNPNSRLANINVFVDNSGYDRGIAIWNKKRAEYVAKKEAAAEKARQLAQEDGDIVMDDAC